jgi:hypothetical protein
MGLLEALKALYNSKFNIYYSSDGAKVFDNDNRFNYVFCLIYYDSNEYEKHIICKRGSKTCSK